MSYADNGRGRERVVAISLVALVQGGIIAALLSGLAVHVINKPHDPTLRTYAVPEDPPPPPPTEALPPEQPSHPAARPLVIVPLPPVDLPTANPLPATPETSLPPPLTLVPAGPVEPVAPRPAVDLARGAGVRGDVAGWFPQEGYPPAALRAGVEGRVGVAVTVTPAGRAGTCEVVATSGSGELDTATCRLALRNGRFEPARDRAGNAVATRLVLPSVRWRLER